MVYTRFRTCTEQFGKLNRTLFYVNTQELRSLKIQKAVFGVPCIIWRTKYRHTIMQIRSLFIQCMTLQTAHTSVNLSFVSSVMAVSLFASLFVAGGLVWSMTRCCMSFTTTVIDIQKRCVCCPPCIVSTAQTEQSCLYCRLSLAVIILPADAAAAFVSSILLASVLTWRHLSVSVCYVKSIQLSGSSHGFSSFIYHLSVPVSAVMLCFIKGKLFEFSSIRFFISILYCMSRE